MKVTYQLWGLPPAAPDWHALPDRLRRLLHACPAQAVVCGLGAPEETYARLRDVAHELNALCYLWLPLFSEMDGLCTFDPLIDFKGNNYLKEKKAGSGFIFRCPSCKKNLDVMLAAFEPLLSQNPWDGVFLDRIRYPSFQYGLSGVLGCFCPSCAARYLSMGLHPPALREACRRVAARASAGAENPLGLTRFALGRWQVADRDLQALLDARCQIITDAVSEACVFLRKRGLRVGLDLFTPALGYFAGQAFARLVPLADFVKPMLYLRTHAPAGLPYELAALNAALGGRGGESLLALRGAESIPELIKTEVADMAQAKRAHGFLADILCGVEYNRVQPIAPVTPATIRQDVQALRDAGAEGIVASWSLLAAPEENVAAFAQAAKG